MIEVMRPERSGLQVSEVISCCKACGGCASLMGDGLGVELAEAAAGWEGTSMAFTTDNRYIHGASGAAIPEHGVTAAYGARWIDRNTWADVVPDRQGFAWNSVAARDMLMAKLNDGRYRDYVRDLPRDETVVLADSPQLSVCVRRSGGYFYVDAWTQLS